MHADFYHSEFDQPHPSRARSEEHTSELQSPYDVVCRLLLEKNKEAVVFWHVHDAQKAALNIYNYREAVDRVSQSFFFNDTATTEIYTLSLHDALPISGSTSSPSPSPPSSCRTSARP